MTNSTMQVGVMIERRDADSEWIDHTWHVADILPGAPEIDAWVELGRDGDRVRYHAATTKLEIFKGETEGYKYNLSLDPPVVFVVLDPDCEGETPVEVSLATVCPYEAQDYLDGSEVQVESVPMPAAVAAWLADFVERHHVDVPFKKRKRVPHPDTAAARNELFLPPDPTQRGRRA